jgi:hypothetical protein
MSDIDSGKAFIIMVVIIISISVAWVWFCFSHPISKHVPLEEYNPCSHSNMITDYDALFCELVTKEEAQERKILENNRGDSDGETNTLPK